MAEIIKAWKDAIGYLMGLGKKGEADSSKLTTDEDLKDDIEKKQGNKKQKEE